MKIKNATVRHRIRIAVKVSVTVLASALIVCAVELSGPWTVAAVSSVAGIVVAYLAFQENRTRFYFVTFVRNGTYGRVYLRFPDRVPVSVMEKAISDADGNGPVTVVSYKRIKRYEYELNIEK